MPPSAPPAHALQEAAEIAGRFGWVPDPGGLSWLGRGLINRSFLLSSGGRPLVLQRLNPEVFPRPRPILENLVRLSAHLAERPDLGVRIPALIRGIRGQAWVQAEDGACWRLLEYIEGGTPLEALTTARQAEEVGHTLGRFHRAVADPPLATLAETLPNFHVTPHYVARLRLLRPPSAVGQAGEVRAALAFVNARAATAGGLEQARHAGQLPQRVIHGDPKLDNILFDPGGRHALALIDLDTVQPGLLHYDLGDCLRSCCNRHGEGTTGAQRPIFDLFLCRQVLGAYAESVAGLLRKADIAWLFEAIRLIPFELGVRFLTDHLEGDRWFRVARPGENLARAQVQFALTRDIEAREAAIREIIEDCFR